MDGNLQDRRETILLHSSSYHGRLEISQRLLDLGVNSNAKNHRSETALHMVSRGECDSQDGVRVARLLLERGADVDVQRRDHWTPLHVASYFGKAAITELLLEHSANASAKTDGGETPLHVVSCGEYNEATTMIKGKLDGYVIEGHLINRDFIDIFAHIAQLLLKRVVDVNAQCKDQRTPLHVACSYGKPEIARLLLGHDADANAKDNKGRTPLHAVSGGKYQSQEDGARIARLLLEHGADMNRKEESNATPLHVASYHNKYEIVRLLLAHGAKAKVDGDGGETALHGVARVKYESPEEGVSVAQVLLECGIDVDARSKDDLTPLHFASDFGKLEIAQLLLDHGTNVNAKGVNGATPLHFASSCVYKSPEDGVRVALLLLERGADVDAQRDNHWTPLHYASNDGMLEVARVLLDHDANANARLPLGTTPCT